MDLTVICWCGHVVDEHEGRLFRPCTVEGCECEDYDGQEEDDD